MNPSEAISPTAHYTGYVWARNGLSHPELQTREGRVAFESLRPWMTLSAALGGPTLESYLLARHRAIDTLLRRAIENDDISQVIEVACGLSARGWRFTNRHPELVYIEADLAGMAVRKRRALERMGALSERHRVVELDALREDGPTSLPAVASELEPAQGLAIITEGLLGYLPREAVNAIWERFARVLSGFATGRYISDIHIGELQTPQVRVFRVLLSTFVRGRVHLHFGEPDEVEAALRTAGFTEAEVRPAGTVSGPDGDAAGRVAHVLEAST